MLYLLDANVFIDANRDYYPINRVPEFWEWLAYQGNSGAVKVPIEIQEEIKDSKDDLGTWSKQPDITEALLLDESAEPQLVAQVTSTGYAPDLSEEEIIRLGRDPFLLSYAFSDLGNRTVVTTEVSKPKKQRANRRIPDVCADLRIPCVNTFEFLRSLDFSTNWRP